MHRKTESPTFRDLTPTHHYHQQLHFLFETLEFLLNKVSELCQWQIEQDNHKRRRSMVKLIDKNVDTLPIFKHQTVHFPVFDQFPKILSQLQLSKAALPPPNLQLQKTNSFHADKPSNAIDSLWQYVESIQTRTKSLQSDMMELIILYKDLL